MGKLYIKVPLDLYQWLADLAFAKVYHSDVPLTKEQAQECLKILDELQAMLENSESTSGGA